MNSLKNGLLIVVAIVTINLFAAEGGGGGPFGYGYEVGGAAAAEVVGGLGLMQELIMIPVVRPEAQVSEDYMRIILSDGTMQDYPNNELANLTVLKNIMGDLPDEQDLLPLGFKNAEDLEG